MYRIIIILSLISSSVSAQVYQYLGTPIRVTDNRGYFMSDSGNKAFTVGDTISATYLSSADKIGDARLKSNIPYVRTSTQWIRLATGQLDSTIYATKYDLDTTRTGVNARIAVKLNITDTTGKWVTGAYRSNDSVFVIKGGAGVYSFKDSTGAPADTNTLKTNTPISLVLDTVYRGAINSALQISTIGVLVNTASLGTTQHDSSGITVSNATAAAAGAQQISPGIRWRGYGWKTNATAGSFATDFQAYVLPVEGAAAPTVNWLLRSKVGAGAYATKLTVKSDALAIVFDTFGETINGTGILRADASNMGMYFSNQSNGYLNGTATGWLFNYGSTAKSATSGSENLVAYTYTVSPASGSYVHYANRVNGTINQNASATGVTGAYISDPTLTNAIEWRSFSWTNNSHWGLYGVGTAKNYLAGNLLLKTTTDEASSLLTTSSTTQGSLPNPRMTVTQRNAIGTPATGLVIYNTTYGSTDTYNGTQWMVEYSVSQLTNAATTLSLSTAYNYYQYTTNSNATWTLQAVGACPGRTITIFNKGARTITLNSNAGGNDIWNAGTLVNTINIVSGGYIRLYDDGTTYNLTN